MRSALHDRELRLASDLVHEPDAARAHDAALGVIDDHRPEHFALWFIQLVGTDARRLVIVLHVIILQLALARLIADRAIDRVIDQMEFHAPALVVLHRG